MQSPIAITAAALSTDPREAIRLARELKFAGLLFDAYSKSLAIPDLSQTGRREFRQVCISNQIGLFGLQGDIGPKGFGPTADIDFVIRQIDRAMEAAAGLAAPLLCLEIGPLAAPPVTAAPKPIITPDQAGLLILPTQTTEPAPAPPPPPSPAETALGDSVNAALAELGVRADRYSVFVAFRSSLASFAALERAINAARCPWFGIDLDPAAMLSDEWPADELFSRLGSLVRHVRAKDAIKGSDRRTKAVHLGEGSVEWPAMLARLDQAGYHGWLTVDPTDLPDRVEGANRGRDLLVRLTSAQNGPS